MDKKKKIFFVSTLIFFIVGGFLLFAPNKKKIKLDSLSADSSPQPARPTFINVSTSATAVSQVQNDVCQTLRAQMPALNDWQKNGQAVSERFTNIHKNINGQIYRLRTFFKEHAEGETPVYLVYKEDQNEEAHIIETSNYKKGREFLKIEKAKGEILYTEKGLSIGDDQSFFVHYVNSELKGFQGSFPQNPTLANVDCRF